ncbi:YggT family protein [Paraferrimonas haliotis]|uniref:Membrane protein n=1 Tax=Paraferrimonas haliotis TaxID=2013866 RepID=A0AA37TVS1_9GAMM|nr:YggT family protein [Paraferrimonas haliotis]GLS83635.1 membrane protein [Paraferrimonas haliotis]
MNSMNYLVTVIFELYLMIVVLRIWLQFARADFYHPVSQFIVKATQPVVGPLRRVIPPVGQLDTASLLLALMVAGAKWVVLMMMQNAGIDWAGAAVLAVLGVIKEFGTLLFWMLLIRAILSWVSQGQNPFEFLLAQLTEPLMAPIRRIIPPMGGLDLSLLVLMIGLNFANILMHDLIGPLWRLA